MTDSSAASWAARASAPEGGIHTCRSQASTLSVRRRSAISARRRFSSVRAACTYPGLYRALLARKHPLRDSRGARKRFDRAIELLLVESSALLPPRTHRVQADDEESLRPVEGLHLAEGLLPGRKRPRDARVRVGDVVVARDGEVGDRE